MRSHTVNSFKRNTANFRAKDERVRFIFQKTISSHQRPIM